MAKAPKPTLPFPEHTVRELRDALVLIREQVGGRQHLDAGYLRALFDIMDQRDQARRGRREAARKRAAAWRSEQ